MTDLTVTITKAACDHVTIKVFKAGVQVGREIFSLTELKEELADYDTARDRLIAQIKAVVIENKNRTMAQIKQAVELETYRV